MEGSNPFLGAEKPRSETSLLSPPPTYQILGYSMTCLDHHLFGQQLLSQKIQDLQLYEILID